MRKTLKLKMFLYVPMILSLSLFSCEKKKSEEKAELNDQKAKVSYIIGASQISGMKESGIEINLEALIQGMKDSYEEKELAISEEEIQEIMTVFQTEMRAKQQTQREQQMADHNRLMTENLEKANVFWSENKSRPGVITLPDSIQYEVLKKGSGPSPSLTDSVRVNYRGTFLDGKEFDSSYKYNKPMTFVANQVIKGWSRVLPLMKTGDKWKVYIPPQYAYGQNGNRMIPPNSFLIFEVELLEVIKPK